MIEVYGEGHLAEAVRVELDLHHSHYRSAGVTASVGLVAHDVTDHSDALQMRGVESAFKSAATRHKFVVVMSQVPPGTTRRLAGGREGVFYQVDTIIVSRAVARLLRPEQIIVGCASPSEPLPLAYQGYLALHDCPVLQMSYESAELAKCAINYMLAKQIEAAKDLASVAERAGASYPDVERALRGDARIGPSAYVRPGVSNQHLDRDVATVRSMIPNQVVDRGR